MSENEILNDIRNTFDSCVSVTPEKMLSLLDEGISERAAVIEHRTFRPVSYLRIACAVFLVAVSAAALYFAGSRKDLNSDPSAENNIPALTEISYSSAVTDVSERNEILRTESSVSVSDHKRIIASEAAEKHTGSFTDIPAVTEETSVSVIIQVPADETVSYQFTEVYTEERTDDNFKTEAVPPVVTVPYEETTEVTETSELQTEESPQVSESEVTAETEFPEVTVKLEINPLWREPERDVFVSLTGKDYIYTVKNPDKYSVKFYFGDHTETLTVEMAVAMHIVTVDALVESGMEYEKKISVR